MIVAVFEEYKLNARTQRQDDFTIRKPDHGFLSVFLRSFVCKYSRNLFPVISRFLSGPWQDGGSAISALRRCRRLEVTPIFFCIYVDLLCTFSEVLFIMSRLEFYRIYD